MPFFGVFLNTAHSIGSTSYIVHGAYALLYRSVDPVRTHTKLRTLQPPNHPLSYPYTRHRYKSCMLAACLLLLLYSRVRVLGSCHSAIILAAHGLHLRSALCTLPARTHGAMTDRGLVSSATDVQERTGVAARVIPVDWRGLSITQ